MDQIKKFHLLTNFFYMIHKMIGDPRKIFPEDLCMHMHAQREKSTCWMCTCVHKSSKKNLMATIFSQAFVTTYNSELGVFTSCIIATFSLTNSIFLGRLVNLFKIKVIQNNRMETNLGESPASANGSQLHRAD